MHLGGAAQRPMIHEIRHVITTNFMRRGVLLQCRKDIDTSPMEMRKTALYMGTTLGTRCVFPFVGFPARSSGQRREARNCSPLIVIHIYSPLAFPKAYEHIVCNKKLQITNLL